MADPAPGGADEGRKKKRSITRLKGLGGVLVGQSGAVATLIVALISNPSGTVDVITGSSPAPATTTITPSQAPRHTITVTASPVATNPGPVSLPDCPASQGCKAYNLVVRPDPGDSTGITFATGAVTLGELGDLSYEKTPDGTLEIVAASTPGVYSTDVTPQQANHQGCEALTTSDADPNPITGFHQGLAFCVAINTSDGGIALCGRRGRSGRAGCSTSASCTGRTRTRKPAGRPVR